MSNAELKWTGVQSSNIRSLAYHEPTRTLAVKFHNGSLYSYDSVPMDVYDELLNAPSVGQFFARTIKLTSGYERWEDENELIAELSNRDYSI